MPETFRTTTTATVGGVSYTNVYADEGNSREQATPSLGPAKTGTLTTRTDNDTGTLTMAAGHGITTAAKLDVYWLDPTTGDPKSRRNMTAGTVATNSVPVDGGSGDNLPVAATAITAMVPETIPFAIDGDQVVGIAISAAAWGHAVFMDDTGTPVEIAASDVEFGPSFTYIWARQQGTTNPLAGSVTSGIKLSHGDAAAARTVTVAVVFNPES